ncbi:MULTISPECIES: undecaprenyldiphospho-muramoylpentapeptide beta-N-acetylglucosaminyltransferase [Leptolyngbya]|uniref:undecaprenyldiphospho-muramoylpentapeptide beta-N-acetylglucosaminyltransferase n=1 Tax=Leptolyngbya TaxID=47251 RepID=UPI00168A305A|nr:undecaprenyldiphospho-muramoylpentapeptide beta-N-acetylglucosaminyltransferase [Leptolyngbya sp. UWPOB_LEPTO1]MBD1859614.1 undecaprenyldiphospho-muramoylpentapeptide beta-N-acetylglucosaminyltransferase [Leptolyngbya sp. FACHB-1624]MBN8561946.1 undecaprenyldiphospho-muramoylpentapeptide beta-N-acetylglucosaminyltransferase [Leptolyngbya sp. UWPOB_LEPTO1]
MESSLNQPKSRRLLIAASGTGGHVFPAIAIAEQLPEFHIEWLGVPDRLESQLVGDRYPMHKISVAGFQQKFGLGTLKILFRLINSIRQVRQIIRRGKFEGVVTTGGYISAPAIIAARTLGLPVILHESNALPGKVTRFFAPWCTVVAIGFDVAAKSLRKAKTVVVGTPVRSQFRAALANPELPDLPIPSGVPLIVVVGGSQGAVAMNKLVREAAPAWFEKGAWVVHLTGENDPDVKSLQHPQYLALPFYQNMAALFQRADLAISRSGAGTVTELLVTGTPAILIPYPFAAEDHQAFNAMVMVRVGAAEMFRQAELTAEQLQQSVLDLLNDPARLATMSQQALSIAIIDSAERTAQLVREAL